MKFNNPARSVLGAEVVLSIVTLIAVAVIGIAFQHLNLKKKVNERVPTRHAIVDARATNAAKKNALTAPGQHIAAEEPKDQTADKDE